MSAWTRWRARLRTVLQRDALDRDLDRELGAWVDELTARYQAEGLPPPEARPCGYPEVRVNYRVCNVAVALRFGTWPTGMRATSLSVRVSMANTMLSPAAATYT